MRMFGMKRGHTHYVSVPWSKLLGRTQVCTSSQLITGKMVMTVWFTGSERNGMRGPTREELQKTQPPALRMGSKTTQAYLEMRRKILLGEYPADHVLIPKQIEEEY